MIARVKEHFNDLVWHADIEHMPKWKRPLIRLVRIMVIAVRGFVDDKLQLHASALTFYSLLSVVPIFALLFAVAKGFGFEKKLESELLNTGESHQDIVVQVVEFANSLLDNTKGGLIAGIGSVMLLWSVMKVLGNIERSFNDIWQISESRNWVRKFTEYLSIMLVAPILMLLSSSVSVFIVSSVKGLTETFVWLDTIGPVLFFFIKLIPYLLFALLFTLIYIVMPNTKVQWKGALLAGIIAGSIFQMTEYAFVNLEFGVSRYNAIYGSFAALPLFLIFLQVAWLIVLFGAEISFAYQNVNNYLHELDHREISPNLRRMVALMMTVQVVRNFESGQAAPTIDVLADALKVPEKLVRKLTDDLVEAKVLSKITSDIEDYSFQPGVSTDKITIQYVFNALDEGAFVEISLPESNELGVLKEKIEGIRDSFKKSSSNVLLKNI